MARIRTVKPEFWADEKIGTLSPYARLAFIGSWNHADDEGLLRWTSEFLSASVFMYDGLPIKKVQGIMSELAEADLVFPYEVGTVRQKLAYVVNFRVHQKINRPQPSKLEPPALGSERTRLMYAKRDKWICHLCGGPINRERLYADERYGDDGESLRGDVELNLSLDHVVPRIEGGTDHPSNIKCAHLSCNKARRNLGIDDFSVPDSVRRALGHSLNPHGTISEDSLQEGKGREGNREGNARERADPPPPTCPQHRDDPNPPSCGRCKDHRIARERWDAKNAERQREERLAIHACRLCDGDGWRWHPDGKRHGALNERCDHRPLRSVS